MIKKFGLLIILFLAYLVGCTIGFFSGVNDSHTTDYSNHSQKTNPLYELCSHERFWAIFKNNIIVSFNNLLFGAFSFGLLSIFYLFYNGFVFGYVIGRSTQIMTFPEIAKATIPHSFEFLGIVLYGYIGYVFSVYLYTKKALFEKKTILRIFIMATIIILVAAIIENYVSMSVPK